MSKGNAQKEDHTMTKKELNKELANIARKNIIGFSTFERKHSDSLDFLETSVWSIKSALRAAYELVLEEGKSTCCSSNQATTPITFALFSHAVDVSLGTLQINTGLDSGSIKTFAITVTRYRRRSCLFIMVVLLLMDFILKVHQI